MISQNGTNPERDLAQEVPRRSLPISEIQTTVREIPK